MQPSPVIMEAGSIYVQQENKLQTQSGIKIMASSND